MRGLSSLVRGLSSIIARVMVPSLVRAFRPPLRALPKPGWQGSRTKLRPRDTREFELADSHLFRDIAGAVCSTATLPRKELFEAWEVASRVDAKFPNATRVADLAAGHGLLGWMLLLLAWTDGRPRSAVCVDVRMPASADTLSEAMLQRWPDLRGSLDYVEGGLEHVQSDPSVLITSVHACGPLTDAVLERAVRGGAPVAVMPCCHSLRKQAVPQYGSLPELLTVDALRERAADIGAVPAIDSARIEALRAMGYLVLEEYVDPTVTPYNKLIMALPNGGDASSAHVGTAPAEARESLGRLETPPAKGSTRRELRSIPLMDVAAIRAISGRRPFESRRSMEVSLWLPEGAALGEVALATLAELASAAAWRPRSDGGAETAVPPGAQGGRTHSRRKRRPYWDVEAAVLAAREAGASTASGTPPPAKAEEKLGRDDDDDDEASDGGASAEQPVLGTRVEVEVALRETYHAEGSGRRACAFSIEFVSKERELSRGEVGMWQARVREALEWWAADEGANGGGPVFELR